MTFTLKILTSKNTRVLRGTCWELEITCVQNSYKRETLYLCDEHKVVEP